jgi:P27 family predicted phage terminase small subunit
VGGRPPTPSALKELHGNPGRRPLNENEPKPNVYLPEKPPYEMSEQATQIFRSKASELYQCGILTNLDAEFLAIWAEMMAEYVEIKKEIQEQGRVYYKQRIDGSGNELMEPSRNPNMITLENLRREIRFYSARLGTEPSARVKLQVIKVDENEFDDFLRKKSEI